MEILKYWNFEILKYRNIDIFENYPIWYHPNKEQRLQTKTYSQNSSFTLYFRSSHQGSESNKLKLKINCYIFNLHINCCFKKDRRLEDGILFYTHDLVQLGPLNLIRSEVISAVKQEIRMISSYNVPVNWWTDFSSWQDFRGLLHSGTAVNS